MYKKYRATGYFLIVLMLFIFGAFPIIAKTGETCTTVRVGYMKSYGINIGEDGRNSGYMVDYLNEISKYTDWNYQFVEGTWTECLKMLEKGQIDLMGQIHMTPERQSMFDFSCREMGIEYGAIYIDEDRSDIYYDDPDSLDGLKVATIENSYFESYFEEYCKEYGIDVEMVYVDTSDYADGLKEGEFDAALGGSTLDVPGSVVACKITAAPFYFAVKKGNSEMITPLNQAMNQIFLEDAYFDAKLFQRYFGNKSIGMPAFNQKEIEYVETDPVLHVVCNPNWIPISYVEEGENKIQGIAIDLLKKVCEETEIQLEFSIADTFEEGLARIQDGSADLILGYDQYDDENLVYSDTILDIPMVIAGTGPIDLSQNIRVGIHSPTVKIDEDMRKNYPNFQYVEYDSVRDVLKAMRTGKENYAIFNYYAFDELKRSAPKMNFQFAMADVSFPVIVGVSKNADPNILPILDKSMKRISSEEISSVAFENSVYRSNRAVVEQLLYENRLYLIAIGLAITLVIVLIILGVSYNNRRTLRKMAYFDEITGVFSIEKFRIETEHLLKDAKSGEYFMIALDINKFKYINDTYGYDLGNQVLISIAQYLKEFQAEDYKIGRISADNFVMIMKAEVLSVFLLYLSKIDGYIHGNIEVLPSSYPLTYSLGYCRIDSGKEAFNTLLDKVNFARKQKRAENINNVTEYTEKMDQQASWKKEVTMYMEMALAERQFVAYYQPKYDFITETLVGAEALVRWKHPKYGLLPPGRFITIFEQNGFIRKLDLYIFEAVCRFLSYRIERNLPVVKISVNLSRIHLESDTFEEELQSILKYYRLDPRWIEVELTESVLLEDQQMIVKGMEKIKDLGLSISIDDFGSGYSSLSLLSELPVNVLKIDKMFVDQAANTENGKKVIIKIIELAKSIQLHTVAEGVETAGQVDMLRKMGCEIAQGYYYSRPLPQEEFEKLFE